MAARPRAAFVVPHTDSLTVSPPTHLGYLASMLENDGWEAAVFDFTLPGANGGAEEILKWEPAFVGVSAKTVEFESAKQIIAGIKAAKPGMPVVLGGIHPTALPAACLEESEADIVVRGEGEMTIVELARYVAGGGDLSEIDGIAYGDNGEVVLSPDREYISDLDSIPFPDWSLMPPEKYSVFPWQLFKKRNIVATILTSRGCPHSCTFCASRIHGKKIRTRSAGNVVDEMEMLVEEFSVDEFQIMDDNFTFNKGHAKAVCEEMISRKLDVVWKTPNGVRCDRIDDELVAIMKESGCYQLGFGIESGSEEILRNCKKNLDLSIVEEKVRMVRKHGIEVYGFFILGLPGETKETMEQTIKFMKKGFDHVNVSFCIPYPGSEIFGESRRGENKITDWSTYIHYRPFPVTGFTEEELKGYIRKAILGFYARPRNALGLAAKLSRTPVKYVVNLVLKYIMPAR